MKSLKNKIVKALNSLRDVKGIPGCPNLFFSSLPDENKKEYFAAVEALEKFYNNLPK